MKKFQVSLFVLLAGFIFLFLENSLSAQGMGQSGQGQPPPMSQAEHEKMEKVRAVCDTDREKLCQGIPPGPGVLQCLNQHKSELSADCQAVLPASPPARE
jgi:hypothetical protein